LHSNEGVRTQRNHLEPPTSTPLYSRSMIKFSNFHDLICFSLNSFNPNPTVRHTWFSIIIGNTFTFLTLNAINQAQVQRLLTVKNLKSAQTAVFMSWPILSFLQIATCFSGLVIYYYYRNCDPIKQGRIELRDQYMPLYVIDGEFTLIFS
jgi:uncharacterized sodium:solute symporter family permease YidK